MADLRRTPLEFLQDDASAGSNGTVRSFNNNGDGPQNFVRANINSGAYSGDGNGLDLYRNRATNGAPRGSNGTVRSFNNNGSGGQDFSGATINSGAYSGNGNGSYNKNNFGGNVIENRGVTYGNGNGSIIRGNFDSSTGAYYNQTT